MTSDDCEYYADIIHALQDLLGEKLKTIKELEKIGRRREEMIKRRDDEVAYLRGKIVTSWVNDMRPNSNIADIRELLQLCHPDKHNNSPLSQRVTQRLLGQRGTTP